MENGYYSVPQIAQLVHMHPKTIQRYIREGKLRAVKLGRGWRVTGHDLSAFMEANKQQSDQTHELSPQERTKASAVIDIAVIRKDEAQRLILSMNAAMNVKPKDYGRASLHTQYLEAESAVRLSLWGNLPFTAAVLDILNTYLQQMEGEAL